MNVEIQRTSGIKLADSKFDVVNIHNIYPNHGNTKLSYATSCNQECTDIQ